MSKEGKIMKNRIVATILALLLGGIGLHKFYLNDNKKGILYFLFSWTFIPYFFGLIDAIILLLMSDEAFNLMYNVNYDRDIQTSEKASEKEKYKKMLDMGIIDEETYNQKVSNLD